MTREADNRQAKGELLIGTLCTEMRYALRTASLMPVILAFALALFSVSRHRDWIHRLFPWDMFDLGILLLGLCLLHWLTKKGARQYAPQILEYLPEYSEFRYFSTTVTAAGLQYLITTALCLAVPFLAAVFRIRNGWLLLVAVLTIVFLSYCWVSGAAQQTIREETAGLRPNGKQQPDRK